MATSPASGPGGGGFDGSAGLAYYGGNPVTIADAAGAYATWDSLFAGTELMDRAVPTQPAVLAAGVYAVAVLIRPSGLTDMGAFLFDLILSDTTPGAVTFGAAQAPMPAGASWRPTLSATAVGYMPAGGIVGAYVSNRDGAVSRDFSINAAIVQRIS